MRKLVKVWNTNSCLLIMMVPRIIWECMSKTEKMGLVGRKYFLEYRRLTTSLTSNNEKLFSFQDAEICLMVLKWIKEKSIIIRINSAKINYLFYWFHVKYPSIMVNMGPCFFSLKLCNLTFRNNSSVLFPVGRLSLLLQWWRNPLVLHGSLLTRI